MIVKKLRGDASFFLPIRGNLCILNDSNKSIGSSPQRFRSNHRRLAGAGEGVGGGSRVQEIAYFWSYVRSLADVHNTLRSRVTGVPDEVVINTFNKNVSLYDLPIIGTHESLIESKTLSRRTRLFDCGPFLI